MSVYKIHSWDEGIMCTFKCDDEYNSVFTRMTQSRVEFLPLVFPLGCDSHFGNPLSCVQWRVFSFSLSAASLQRKSPQGKRKRRLVHIMKSPPVQRQRPRSLLKTPQTHRQVRAEGKTRRGRGCLLFLSCPPKKLTLVTVVQLEISSM